MELLTSNSSVEASGSYLMQVYQGGQLVSSSGEPVSGMQMLAICSLYEKFTSTGYEIYYEEQ